MAEHASPPSRNQTTNLISGNTDEALNKVSKRHATDVLKSVEIVPSSVDSNPVTISKRTKPSYSSNTTKKLKQSRESPTKLLEQKTNVQQDILPKKANFKTADISSKVQTLPKKKPSSLAQSKELIQNEGNSTKRHNNRKEAKKIRPLSTEFSLSATSPAVLHANQAVNMAKMKGKSLRHSWHGTSGLRSGPHGKSHSISTQQKAQKGKLLKKGKTKILLIFLS